MIALDAAAQITAVAAVAQGLVLLGALVYATKQLGEARQTREATLRPFVVIDLDAATPPVMYVKIANVGPIMARNVRFAFTPPLASSIYDDPPISEIQLFKEGIGYLPPGKEIRIQFDYSMNRWDGEELKPGLASRHDVQITYESGLSIDRRRFDERTSLDLRLYLDTLYSQKSTLTDVDKRLKELVKVLSSWTSSVPKGLRTVTPQTERRAIADWRRTRDKRQSRPTTEQE